MYAVFNYCNNSWKWYELIISLVLDTCTTLLNISFSVIQSGFIINPLSTTLSVGANLLLFCLHSGSFPAASITWTKNGSPLVPGGLVTASTEVLQHTNPPQVYS